MTTDSSSLEPEKGTRNGRVGIGGWLKRTWLSIRIPVVAVLLSLLIGAIVLIIAGANPIEAYLALLKGAFGSQVALRRTLEKATPLVFTGLAVAFAFKGGLFNIGAQGQLLLGAIVAAAIGFGISGLPFIIHMPLALAGGALAGAMYGAIPGLLKAWTGAHEVITTIMLNFIAINITDYLADGTWKDTSASNIISRTPKILPSAEIPSIAFVPIGFLVGIVMAFVTWYVLYKTTLGYEIRTVGLSSHAAKYAGIRVAATIVLTMTLSGVLAGMGGAIETLGIVGRFQPGFNLNLGFDGITVALLARTNPFGVIPAAILLGALRAGAGRMQLYAGVPSEITDIIAALMLFFVSADMIVRWIIRAREPAEEEKVTLSTWGQS
ncbi:MAG TPA: ABC transporter permease [candidate division Zixibacteria bacterium]|nr:ABC transporter permease [candidate division Zixibacteria bacterium]